MKLRELATRLQCPLEGDGDVEIVRVAGIQSAQPGDLIFVANAKFAADLAATRASAVILGPRATFEAPCPVIRAADSYSTFARALALLAPATAPTKGVDRLTAVAPGAAIGADVSIGPFVTIGAGASIGARTIVYPNVAIGADVTIGDDCTIHSHVSLRDRVTIGHRVILHDGVVVGSDGFGFVRQPDGSHLKIPQQAAVVIEDDVEIGANAAIDRPPLGETRIRAGSKIDNLVHIAHGVSIGRRVLLAAQTGIAGSTTVGDDTVMGGQAGVIDHVKIGSGVRVGAGSAVMGSVSDREFVTGNPAIEHQEWRKASVILRRLPSIRKRVDQHEERIAELERRLAQAEMPGMSRTPDPSR
jgi:UDP-3-O-[3-hydroxymyristoyl] glucosamine N-acyltransferase